MVNKQKWGGESPDNDCLNPQEIEIPNILISIMNKKAKAITFSSSKGST